MDQDYEKWPHEKSDFFRRKPPARVKPVVIYAIDDEKTIMFEELIEREAWWMWSVEGEVLQIEPKEQPRGERALAWLKRVLKREAVGFFVKA